MVADKIVTFRHGGDRRSDQDANLHLDSATHAKAAELLNVSRRSVEAASIVRDKGIPELVEAVETREMSVYASGRPPGRPAIASPRRVGLRVIPDRRNPRASPLEAREAAARS